MQPPGMGYYFKFEVGFSFTSLASGFRWGVGCFIDSCVMHASSGMEGVHGGNTILKCLHSFSLQWMEDAVGNSHLSKIGPLQYNIK